MAVKDVRDRPAVDVTPKTVVSKNAKYTIVDIQNNNVVEATAKDTQHPGRYLREGGQHECIKVCEEWFSPAEYVGAMKFQVIKYLCRLGEKDDAYKESVKAKFYMDDLTEFLKQMAEGGNPYHKE